MTRQRREWIVWRWEEGRARPGESGNKGGGMGWDGMDKGVYLVPIRNTSNPAMLCVSCVARAAGTVAASPRSKSTRKARTFFSAGSIASRGKGVG